MTEIIVLICKEVPAMISTMIAKGWVERADRQKCIWVMAKSKSVVSLLDFTDDVFMARLMRAHPSTIKYISVESIPESQYASMLENMGVSMHPCFWTLCTDIIKKKIVSNEVACGFLRRAIHAVEISKCVAFLSEVDWYDFSDNDMLHYLAPMLCSYLVDYPGKPFPSFLYVIV